jgi:endoribonuclease Dicer
MFETLQQRLGYTFRNGHLLREALTHPSFASAVEMIPSYQRLEFLGDGKHRSLHLLCMQADSIFGVAILDLVVVHYLYNKYPDAASEQLALPRTKAVCAQALAYLAVTKLELHRVVLINNLDLSKAIDSYVPHLQEASPQTIINTGWKFDPPKVLSDVFESVVGAVLIDTGYNYEKTTGIVEHIMEDILGILSPAVRLDPISTLVQWIAGSKCQEKAKFRQARFFLEYPPIPDFTLQCRFKGRKRRRTGRIA